MNISTQKNTVKLTDKAVKALQVTDKPQKFFDEKGLYLYVTEKGLKSWRFDYRFGGKRATVTFGKYPEVSLSLARKKHLEARTNLANGGDPAREKKVQKLERQHLLNNTFDDVARAWYDGKAARRSDVWKESHIRGQDQSILPIRLESPLVHVLLVLEMELPDALRPLARALEIPVLGHIGEIPELSIAKNKRRAAPPALVFELLGFCFPVVAP